MTYHETGYIDDGGKIYIKPARREWLWTILVALSCIVLGVFLAPRLPEQFWAWVYPVEGQTAPSLLPTAAVVFSQPGRPDAPPPRQEEPAPVSVPLFNAPNPTPYDNRAYNATAEARQAEPTVERREEQPAPAVAPALAPTPLPAPGTAEFEPSFQEPVCASGAFITYLPGHPCHGRNGERPLPQPGEDGFVESFAEPGD